MLSYVTDILPQRERNLMVMRLDGSDKRQLTSGFNVWFASWAPDGKKLAVTTEGAEIYTVNPDGTDLHKIAGGAYSPPFWSPDGHFIAFVGGEKFGMPVARGNLRIIPAAGGPVWLVPGGEDIPSLPPGAAAVAWSPDGTKIAAGWPGRILHISGGPGSQVLVEQFKGDGQGKFVVAGGWAPDNRHLAMTDGIDYGILDMQTGEFVTIAKSFKQAGIARPGVSWSAGIRKVAFAINSAAQDGQRLFLADLDGRNPQLILSHPHQARFTGQVTDYGPPFFSADSKTMLLRVSRTTSKGGQLIYTHESWLVRTDGSGGEKLVDGFNANWRPKTRLNLPMAGFWFAWRTTDLPVANQQAARPYLWGPTAIYSGTETFLQAPGGKMTVVYFDKGRMEIVNPSPPQPTRYLVTAGALAKELVTGQIATGENQVEVREPADVLVAGDNPAADAPTYATFNKLAAGTDAGKAQDRTGQPIDAVLAKDGTITQDAALGGMAKVGEFFPQTGHNVPEAFMSYFKGQAWDWVYIAGYPISEPYWTHTEVAGQPRNVLVQVFERRTITYDPAEVQQYQVQFGNVGLQYYNWRYVQPRPPARPTPPATDLPTQVVPEPTAQRPPADVIPPQPTAVP
jgi:Tol biopolymer transport system component